MSVARFDSLAEYMKAERVTDEALARRLNVSRVYVNRLRRRLRKPSLELATKLEALTGIPASVFARAGTAP